MLESRAYLEDRVTILPSAYMDFSSSESLRLVRIGVGQNDAKVVHSSVEKKLTQDEQIVCVFRGDCSASNSCIRIVVFTEFRIITSTSIAFDSFVTSYPWRSVTSWTMNPAEKSMSFTCTGVKDPILLKDIINYSKNLYGFPDLSAAERSFLKYVIGQ